MAAEPESPESGRDRAKTEDVGYLGGHAGGAGRRDRRRGGAAATTTPPPPAPSAFAAARTSAPASSAPASSAPPVTPPTGPVLARSVTVTPDVPSIGVHSTLLQRGANPDRTVQVPPQEKDSKAGWFTYSPTPGQLGPAVVLGHVDSAQWGPGVFYQLGSLQPGRTVDVTRTDRTWRHSPWTGWCPTRRTRSRRSRSTATPPTPSCAWSPVRDLRPLQRALPEQRRGVRAPRRHVRPNVLQICE